MNKAAIRKLCALLVVGCVSGAHAEQILKDPRTRDEDISATEVTVAVNQLGGGLYEYVYSLSSAQANRGIVLSFAVDVACDIEFAELPYPQAPDPRFRNHSQDGLHVPLQGYGAPGQSGPASISAANAVAWLVALHPGNSASGMRLVSPAPPGPRSYLLIPDMDTAGWDYGPYEQDESIPWINDFTVNGTITGPACSTEPVEEPERFPGTSSRGRPGEKLEQLNWLLSYSAPMHDQFHLPAGTTEFEMIIHYGADLEPRTFRVVPERSGLRRLFNPQPGNSETVTIPLQAGTNRIQLQAQTEFVAPGQRETPIRDAGGRGGQSVDHDIFVIRVGEGPSPQSSRGAGK